MSKAILVYGSTTGNTEILSGAVLQGLEKAGLEVTLKYVRESNVNELVDYDFIVFGCSTWGLGELQDDFDDYYNRMENISLAGKKAAVFGPGDDDGYPDTFCDAVDILEDRLRELGAEIVAEGLKVDGDLELAIDDAEEWGFSVAKSL